MSLAAMARTRDLKLGHFVVEFATPGIGHILKNAGCDFVLFDCEHSGFGFETVKAAMRYFEAARLPAIVRVPSKDYDQIARAADMGAEGVMLPMVNDAGEARKILGCLKYTPVGRRGVALGIAHDAYSGGPVLDKLAQANARTTLFCQIETAEGVENADAIAAVDGVDCLWVGHFDLSAALGIPGEFQHEKFLDAIERVVSACRRHGKAAGRLVPDVATGIEYWQKGFDFICYSGDVWALGAAVKAGVEGIRAGAAPRSRESPSAPAAGKGKKKKG
ncbi:MAG: aldolase/citrate lyase family protein [Geminicoccaceae bacterium]|nr:aldolase/citrate lyase family protein [Geminicoccaceae bacterium]MCX8102259.1 aldolase/citrate lyase family protein [Geminicoccaceae bacterium]MDW8371164.1 aldolase/citrate lyase family protein [Geminicoccaceae bacterium]